MKEDEKETLEYKIILEQVTEPQILSYAMPTVYERFLNSQHILFHPCRYLCEHEDLHRMIMLLIDKSVDGPLRQVSFIWYRISMKGFPLTDSSLFNTFI